MGYFEDFEEYRIGCLEEEGGDEMVLVKVSLRDTSRFEFSISYMDLHLISKLLIGELKSRGFDETSVYEVKITKLW